MKYERTKYRNILLTILFIGFVSLTLSAGERQYNTKPYEFISSKLLNGKIVMLGESGTPGHNHLYSPIVVINIIRKWNEQIIKEHSKNKSLTLVLERNPGTVSCINEYIKSGDMKPLMPSEYRGSLENFYLYYHLRLLSSELAKSGNHLEIAGFENDEVYKDDFRFRKTPEEFDFIFGRERDTLIFTKLSKYISANPEKNIFIYYGNAHLSEKYEQKTDSSSLYNGWGYFLGHYMRQEYGNRFVTVEQVNGLQDFGDKFAYLKDSAFIMEKSDSVFANKLPFYCINADYKIIRYETLVAPHFYDRIFSRNVLMQRYNRLLVYDSLDRKYSVDVKRKNDNKFPKNSENILTSLKFLTGRDFTSIADFKKYLDTTESMDYHNRISSKEFEAEIFNNAIDTTDNAPYWFYRRLDYLYRLGMNSQSIRTPDDIKSNWESLWKETVQNMIYFDYVGLYWFGTPAEKNRAKLFLKDYTHEDYIDAADYLEWYYKNIYHYKFE